MRPWTPRVGKQDGPVYLAIADALARDIAAGKLKPGERLPGHRDVAEALSLDVTTVSRAFAEATKRGLIHGRAGRGTFVRGATTDAGRIEVDLRRNSPPEPSSVRPAMIRAMRDLAKGDVGSLAAYPAVGGSRDHRMAGVRFARMRGVTASIERLLVCSGAQHALTTVFGAITSPGDVIVTESSTYQGIIAIARMLQLELVPVSMDEEGLDPDAFSLVCSRRAPKALVTVPTIQNPTAAVMSVGRRRRIAEIARRFGVTLIEDDVYGLLEEDLPGPISVRIPESSYYITSLSKVISPGLRAGYVVAPNAAAANKLAATMQATGWVTPMTVEIATNWLEDGTASRLIAERVEEARERRRIAVEALRPWLKPASMHGYHVWLPSSPQWRPGVLAAALRNRGILVTASEAFAVDPANAPAGIRLCLGAASTREQLASALAIVADLLTGDPDHAHASV